MRHTSRWVATLSGLLFIVLTAPSPVQADEFLPPDTDDRVAAAVEGLVVAGPPGPACPAAAGWDGTAAFGPPVAITGTFSANPVFPDAVAVGGTYSGPVAIPAGALACVDEIVTVGGAGLVNAGVILGPAVFGSPAPSVGVDLAGDGDGFTCLGGVLDRGSFITAGAVALAGIEFDYIVEEDAPACGGPALPGGVQLDFDALAVLAVVPGFGIVPDTVAGPIVG